MRTNNKMKDYDVESKEWWDVVEEYFAKELGKNLAQHRIDERTMKYKLEVYQRNFLDFVYGSPISMQALGHDEETKARPNRIVQKEEVQIKEP